MESARSYTSATKQTTSFTAAFGQATVKNELDHQSFSNLLGAESSNEGDDITSTYERFSNSFDTTSLANKIHSTQNKRQIETVKNECMLYLIRWLYECLFQKKYEHSFDGTDSLSKGMGGNNNASLSEGRTYQFATIQANTSYEHTESEQTQFATTGVVKTADGREISFGLNLSMSRNFQETFEASDVKTIVQMTDPLVINLDGDITQLSDQKFEFDIDCDGILDSISMLSGKNGFLALDQNGNGSIDDGSELFGTKSGDGFKDLSVYDEDGNGWIDENDSIFDKLLIWSKNENGEDELYHLKEKGVGAICLEQVQTDFSLNSLKSNQTNGQIKQTGIFLYENGSVGTLQNIDVAS